MAVATLLGVGGAWPTLAAEPTTSPAAFGSSTVTTEELTGADQYALSVAVSQALWPGGGAPVAYLVSGTASAEALAAGPAAARDHAPILYTAQSSLPAVVATELVRLNPGRVEVMGGTSAIDDSILAEVRSALPPSAVVERLSGGDAYATSVAISVATFQTNTGATFHAVPPGRVLDSRVAQGAMLFHSRVRQPFAVGGRVGVPLDAVAVVGNLTVVGPTRPGYVTLAPSLTSGVAPTTSTINFPYGDTRANGVAVPLGAGGNLDAMYWSASTTATVQLVFDVTGYFANDTTGATFGAVPPGRVLDSRLEQGATLFHSRVRQSFAVGGQARVPLDAVAVVGNLTVVGQTGPGYVTLAPSLASGVEPSTSTINFPYGDTRANGVTVLLGAGGNLDAMYWSASTTATVNLVFDVTGYFANGTSGAMFHAVAPARVLDSRVAQGATLFHSQVRQPIAVGGQAGVPLDAVAVVGNLTVVGETRPGYVTLAPSLTSGVEPSTSTINFPVGDTRANGVTLPLGAGGTLDAMYWSPAIDATTHLVFDVTGYFVDESGVTSCHDSATVVIASVDDPADAALGGSVAAVLDVPFLLVGGATLPPVSAAELGRLRPDRAIIIGGTASVTEAVRNQVGSLVPDAERTTGADVYATAMSIAARFFPSATSVIAASASSGQAGLVSVPLSAARSSPILYVQDTDLLPVPTRDALISIRPSRVTLVGAISVLNQAELVGFSDGRLARPTDATAYPAYDSGYHDPGELYTILKAEEIAYPTLVHIFSIGKSYQGRDIWAAKVSSNVSVDADKPEILVDALHHSDEHLGVEQAIYLFETLTSGYGSDTFVTRIVNERTTWIVFAVNPDGWAYDLSGGAYHFWRKNRQPSGSYAGTATDINRNYGYKWACCGGSSTSPWAWNYHGTAAFSSPEARAVRDFVASRVSGGTQRIRTHLTLHSNGELILYPYGYTRTALPADMKADDHAVFVAMAGTMASMDGYTAEQSSSLYVTDGDEIDWMYHTYGIFSFTIELYPSDSRGAAAATVCQEPQDPNAGTDCVAAAGLVATDLGAVTPAIAAWQVYPPFSVVAAQTSRNRSTLLYAINVAACPYSVIGKAAQYCPTSPPIIPTVSN